MIKKLVNSTLLYMVAGALPAISGMILLIPYTTYLTVPVYGALSIYLSFSILTQILITYSIDNYVAVGYVTRKNSKAELNKFIGTMIILISVVSLITLAAFGLIGHLLFDLFHNDFLAFYPFGLMSLIFAISNVFLRLYSTLLIYQQEPLKYLLINLVNFVLILFFSIYGLKLYPNTLFAPIVGRLISGIVTLVIIAYLLLKQYGITYDKKQLIGVNKYCFPVYKYNIYSWVIIYANNYLILFLDKTTKVLGVFDFTMKCTLIIEVFQNSFCSTINPKIYEIWGAKRIDLEAVNEEYQYHKLFTILNILFIAISIFAIPLVGELIIKKREYIAYFKFLPFMLISFIFRPLLNIYTNCAYFFNNTKALPKMIVISAVIQIIIMYLTFPYIGVWAAIISSFAARLIQVIVLKLITKEKLFITAHKIELLFIPLFYLVLIFGLFSTNKISYFSASCIQLFLSIFITLFYAKSFFNIQLFKKKTLVSDKMNKDED